MGSDDVLTEALIGERLDVMPALPRSVFLLRHLDGLDVAAIGAQLGMESEAVIHNNMRPTALELGQAR